ncbi:hypothetical protein GCM10020295_03550 [Streptomyces cinereospinus]
MPTSTPASSPTPPATAGSTSSAATTTASGSHSRTRTARSHRSPANRCCGPSATTRRPGGWRADKHPRFLADTTGNGRLDIVGCHDDGVWISLQDEDGTFTDPLYVLDDFGADQGWSSVEEHPRFLVGTTVGKAVDVVGFGPQGVAVSRGRGDGTFEPRSWS